jgi:hypothetical protein
MLPSSECVAIVTKWAKRLAFDDAVFVSAHIIVVKSARMRTGNDTKKNVNYWLPFIGVMSAERRTKRLVSNALNVQHANMSFIAPASVNWEIGSCTSLIVLFGRRRRPERNKKKAK